MTTIGMEQGSGVTDPWECVDHFLGAFRDAPYFRPGTQWRDYEPAYRLGCATFERYRGRSVVDLDDELERAWRDVKWSSRLSWSEARAAVDDTWTWLSRREPRDTDRRWRGLYVQLIGLLAQRARRRGSGDTPTEIDVCASGSNVRADLQASLQGSQRYRDGN